MILSGASNNVLIKIMKSEVIQKDDRAISFISKDIPEKSKLGKYIEK